MTVSRVPQFKADLVEALRAEMPDVQVEYAWPGPTAKYECLFLGDVQGDSTIPVMKAGRKIRQENYTVEVIVWVHHNAATPLAAAKCEARAFELMSSVEDVLANNPQFSAVTQFSIASDFATEWAANEKGWSIQLTRQISVQDRLI